MSKNTRLRIGKASIETVKTGKKTRYRLWCRRKEVYINGKSFDDLKEAKAEAYKINAAIEAGQTLDDSELYDLKRIYSDFKVKQELGGKIILPAGSLPGVKSDKEVTFEDKVNHGGSFLELVKEINEKRRRSRLSPFSISQLEDKVRINCLKEIQDSVKPQMSELIRELIHIKMSKTGGKGQRELEKDSKRGMNFS